MDSLKKLGREALVISKKLQIKYIQSNAQPINIVLFLSLSVVSDIKVCIKYGEDFL
jgi:hypothetical protein